jgi:hypothetical protein
LIQLKVNRQEIQDPELTLRIFSLRKRVDKAVDLVDRVKPLEDVPGMFQVKSSKSDEVYVVDLKGGSCTCPDWQFRAQQCKHQIAAKLVQDRLERSHPDYAEIY